MSWKKIEDQKPTIGKRVLVFKMKGHRYHVLTFNIETIGNEKIETDDMFWTREGGSLLSCHPDDMWVEFDPIEIMMKFD